MDIAPSARVPVTPTAVDGPRTAPPSPEAVGTELPADAAVQQAQKSEDTASTHRDASATPSTGYLDRNVTVDLETHKIVFQAIDSRTGDVVMQIPDPRYLQAYKDQLRSTEEAGTGKQSLAQQLA